MLVPPRTKAWDMYGRAGLALPDRPHRVSPPLPGPQRAGLLWLPQRQHALPEDLWPVGCPWLSDPQPQGSPGGEQWRWRGWVPSGLPRPRPTVHSPCWPTDLPPLSLFLAPTRPRKRRSSWRPSTSYTWSMPSGQPPSTTGWRAPWRTSRTCSSSTPSRKSRSALPARPPFSGFTYYLIHYPFHKLFIIARTSTHCCTWLPIKQAAYSGALLCGKS